MCETSSERMQVRFYNHLPSLVEGQHHGFEVGEKEQIRTSLANPCGCRSMLAGEEGACCRKWTRKQGCLRRHSGRREQT